MAEVNPAEVSAILKKQLSGFESGASLDEVGTVLTVPILYRVQISLAIAMAAMMGMLLSEESLSTISSAWVWTTVLASAAIIGVSMITSAWRMTKQMVGIKETNEVID